MGEVLSFSKKKKVSGVAKSKPKTQKPGEKAEAAPKKRRSAKKETLNAESVKLWWISQEFDELIRKAVLEKHIPVEELSAVMAHRLGSLLLVSERTPELTLFCLKLISKITNQPKPGSNAS
ncbi:hypothetical protein EBU99_07885 [bacterium]|nr:hypothetical protein [bacterium]